MNYMHMLMHLTFLHKKNTSILLNQSVFNITFLLIQGNVVPFMAFDKSFPS